nr:hypothetical protein [Tanacetum cinerariifolium]
MKHSRIPLHKVSAATPSKSKLVLSAAARTIGAARPTFSKTRPNIALYTVLKSKAPIRRPCIRHTTPKPRLSPPRVNAANPARLSPTKPEQDLPSTSSAPIIEDWVSDSEEEDIPKVPKNVPSLAQSPELVKTPRHSSLITPPPMSVAPPVPTAVRSIGAARPTFSKTRPHTASNTVSKSKAPIRRPFIRHTTPTPRISPARVNAANPSAVSAARVNTANPSAVSAARVNTANPSAVSAARVNTANPSAVSAARVNTANPSTVSAARVKAARLSA